MRQMTQEERAAFMRIAEAVLVTESLHLDELVAAHKAAMPDKEKAKEAYISRLVDFIESDGLIAE